MQFYTKRRRMPVINVVSLIDVFCLLLIFYIVTTTFKQPEPAVQIKVPVSATAQAGEEQAQEPIVIYATKAQELFVGDEQVPLAKLGEVLKAKKPGAAFGFALKADTDVPLGYFVKVMDAAKEAGITDLSMYTEDPGKNPAAVAPQN
jgi:biopolymer transport protein ExbD